jgi:hypothetical protein
MFAGYWFHFVHVTARENWLHACVQLYRNTGNTNEGENAFIGISMN